MTIRSRLRSLGTNTAIALSFVAAMNFAVGIPIVGAAQDPSCNDNHTRTPIKHVIVIIGENRTFDHIFATYLPENGQTVHNLLSEGIVNADGSPGHNFSKAYQNSACDLGKGGYCPNTGETSATAQPYETSPGDKALYEVLPEPLAGGPTNVCTDNSNCSSTYQDHCMCDLQDAITSENGLASDYYAQLLTGGTGLKAKTPDTRIQHVNDLSPGPFQLTSATFSYDAYAQSPVHRFYQMWQQSDCNIAHGSRSNPDGCLKDLFAWVEVTIGAGSNGLPQAPNFSTEYSPKAKTTGEGSTALGFYNVQRGDAPYLKYLADTYSMSDNYHQAVMGGTGANHIMLGTGDALFFTDASGHPVVPPHNQQVWKGTANAGVVDEVEDPNPADKTNNWYTEDGYGGGGFGSAVYGGGSYTDCSDSSQPGVAAVTRHLASIRIKPNCEPGHYYLLNNYNPGYFGDGSNAYTNHNVNNTPFTIPPSNVRNIGNALLEKNISFAYFGDQFNAYLHDPYQLNYGAIGPTSDQYCNICNFFQYSTSIMTDAKVRTAHLKDTTDLYNDIQHGTLPAVSFVKPSGWVDGHPASSKLILFEGFVKKIVDLVQAKP
ncbi:MAG: phosphoesterase, partial [Deltaproteobacteria bacterium]|nr:phosphoesterase [Deltaproteobacteria bacterium]